MKSTIVILIATWLVFGSWKSIQTEPTEKKKLIYVYDALCGWCFGFSDVMKEFAEKNSDVYEIEVVSGGLRIDDQVGTINEIAPFIKTAYKDVEKTTGVLYGEKFVNGNLKTGEMRINSLPPAMALAIVKELKPEKALEFTRLLHAGIYVENQHPEDLSWYPPLGEKIGIPVDVFQRKLLGPETEKAARADFARAKSLGVSGFPAILTEIDGKFVQVTAGYVSYKSLVKSLK